MQPLRSQRPSSASKRESIRTMNIPIDRSCTSVALPLGEALGRQSGSCCRILTDKEPLQGGRKLALRRVPLGLALPMGQWRPACVRIRVGLSHTRMNPSACATLMHIVRTRVLGCAGAVVYIVSGFRASQGQSCVLDGFIDRYFDRAVARISWVHNAGVRGGPRTQCVQHRLSSSKRSWTQSQAYSG